MQLISNCFLKLADLFNGAQKHIMIVIPQGDNWNGVMILTSNDSYMAKAECKSAQIQRQFLKPKNQQPLESCKVDKNSQFWAML